MATAFVGKIAAIMALSPCDPCSFSRPDLVVIKDIDLDLSVDFDKTVITGTAHLSVEKQSDEANSLVSRFRSTLKMTCIQYL